MHWVWIALLFFLIIFIASPRFRGDIAQTRVRQILSAGLEKNRYTVLNDVTLPSGGSTVHFDHIVVSRFGLFVIKSQYARGQVSGGEFQQRWKQVHFGRVSRFDNPLHRNALQAEALEILLNVPASKLHPVVVMVGHSGFKSAPPGNLVSPEKLISHIRRQTRQHLEADQADRLLKAIEDARIRPDGRGFLNNPVILQILLLLVLVAGAYLAFGDDIADFLRQYAQTEEAPPTSLNHANQDGKSGQELWEDSLVCAYSADTGRCSCSEPGGSRADIEPEKCRALAQRGSLLEQ